MDIQFHFQDIKTFPFPEKRIREWIVFIIDSEGFIPGVINVIYCSDEYLHKMNIEYLDHDTLTDIITFDYTDEFEGINGDIFISVDRIAENAKQFGVTFEEELSRIVAHGILHLIGYDDKNKESKEIMTEKENIYLQNLNT